jgi:hypothetical protein
MRLGAFAAPRFCGYFLMAWYPTGVGAGKIGAGNQRIGLLGAPLVGPQRLALPSNVVTTAIARELAGFVWAIARQVPVPVV